jgi:predicted RNase H-like HicB family nuclease
MSELIFDVAIDEDGRYVAVARGNGIATDGANWAELRANVKELIAAYYSGAKKPEKCQLLLNEVLAVA